jgi:hypothetical protein
MQIQRAVLFDKDIMLPLMGAAICVLRIFYVKSCPLKLGVGTVTEASILISQAPDEAL